MIYLGNFTLLNDEQEYSLILGEKRTVFNHCYPLRLFPERIVESIDFSHINIFYGGNGSGKTTILNVIAEKLRADRKNKISKGPYFDKYVSLCSYEMLEVPQTIKIVTSDDVFDYLFGIRNINANINEKKEDLFEEYLSHKYSGPFKNEEYDELKKTVDSRRMTMSRYVRERLTNNNILEQSNGESALEYFQKEINEKALYILDEPENSLSAASQIKLVKFIEESARFYNCQFIISTHSPILLSLKNAKIFDLDSTPMRIKEWTELENVRIYYNFFKDHEDEF